MPISPMTNITVSLSTAKRLRDAGWVQIPSYFYWATNIEDNSTRWVFGMWDSQDDESHEYVAAPTAEEILRELPWEYEDDEYEYEDGHDRCHPPNAYISNTLYLEVGRNSEDEWRVSYNCPAGGYNKFGDTLANAAAEMWIYLKENNLLPQ